LFVLKYIIIYENYSNYIKFFFINIANIKWLETHVWHSKRMKMGEKWGYKIVCFNFFFFFFFFFLFFVIISILKFIITFHIRKSEYPREKGRKIIYKDEKYTCLLHDASYYQCVEVNGSVNDIKNLFNSIIDLSIPSITSNRYKSNKLFRIFHNIFKNSILNIE